ncbi:MAG: hypothetical protein NZM28_04225, partial [Fimbriimonadales bacterium]|nr:hypothetical protein [Fimbriimonadales bacterium]
MNTVLEVILSLLGAFVPPWSALPFVAIIFAVAGWVLRSLWLEQRRLKLESGQALDAARKVFVNSTNAYSNPTDSLRQWATQSELKDTLTARAVNAFLAVREARNPDLTAALSMLDYREAARLNLARSAPNWLLLIGIMGTIVGLSSAVASLAAPVQQALAEGQAAIAATGLDATMVEIKRAFACSLWGLIAAVSVAMFTRRVASLQQETLGAVHEFMLSEVSPQILPKSEALQLQQIEQTLREGRNFIERTSNMLEDVSRQMQAAVQGFANTLQTGMQGMQNITTALQQSASSIQNSLTQTAQSAQQSAQQLASSAESLRQSSEKLQEHHTHIANAYEALLNAFKTSRDEMESMVQRQIEKIGEYRSAIERTAQEMMLTLNRVIQALADSQSSYRDARDAVLNSNVEIRTALESAITRFQEAQMEVLKKIGEAQTHANQQLTRIAETLREPLDALTSRLAQLLSDHITTRPQGGDPSEQPAPPTTASPVFTDGELVKTLQKLDQTLQQLAQNATAAPVAPVATPNQQPQQ